MVKRKRKRGRKMERVQVKEAPSMVPGHLVRREMDDPTHDPAHPERLGNPKTTEVTVDIRESAVETLYARKHLNRIEKLAADKFRALWETYGQPDVSAFDYSRDRVSSSRAPSPVSEAQIAAREELRRARVLLGARGLELVAKICGEGLALADIGGTNREKTTAADNLRMHLNDLGRMWGLWTAAPDRRRRK